jgi:23S rRNA (guanosine2251-2'-O)-methyltransferase
LKPKTFFPKRTDFSPRVEDDFIFGTRAVIEALQAGRTINKLLVQQGIDNDLHRELKQALGDKNLVIQMVPQQKLYQITRKNHQGVIAFVSPVEYTRVEDILPTLYEEGKNPFIFILDRLTDVRNIGSIARSAEIHGVHALVLPSRGSGMINADAVKTSAGALNKIPVCRELNLKNTIQYLKDSGVIVVGCTEKTETMLPKAKFSGPLAIIMGNEEEGISPEYLKMCDYSVKIPMYGTIESLNVAVSAAIVMYEVCKQRDENREL